MLTKLMRTLLLTVAFTMTPLAQAGGVSASLGSALITLPGSASIPLTLDLPDGQLLGAVTIEVTYDPTVASLASCATNPGGVPGFSLAICFEAEPGTIRTVATSTSGVSGSVVLVELNFDAVAVGQSPLEIVVEELIDPNLLPLAFVVQAGLLTVEADGTDSDGDGISDDADNCIQVPNVAQIDGDDDGIGNLCDADLNGNCIVNAADLALFRAVFLGSDAAADFNSDGVVNPVDLAIFRDAFLSPPGPSALPNACD